MEHEFDKAFEACKAEVVNLHYRWIMYRQIFATNPHRIEVLNRTASNPLAELQWLLLDTVVLTLCRLTDPAEMGKHQNLSVPLLEQMANDLGNAELTAILAPHLETLQSSCEKFRHLRHKRMAHTDLASHKDFAELPLPGISREEVEVALDALRQCMNAIELNISDSQTLYEDCVLPLSNDGRALLIWLQKGLAYEALEDEGTVERGHWRGIGDIDA